MEFENIALLHRGDPVALATVSGLSDMSRGNASYLQGRDY